MHKYQNIIVIPNENFKYPERNNITNDFLHKKNNTDKIEKAGEKINLQKKIIQMEQLTKDKQKMNELLAVSSQELLKTVESITNISTLINSKADISTYNFSLINKFKISINALTRECNEFNKDSQSLDANNAELKLSKVKIITKKLDEVIKEMRDFKFNQLNYFYEEVDEYNFTTVNEINIDFKKFFLIK